MVEKSKEGKRKKKKGWEMRDRIEREGKKDPEEEWRRNKLKNIKKERIQRR